MLQNNNKSCNVGNLDDWQQNAYLSSKRRTIHYHRNRIPLARISFHCAAGAHTSRSNFISTIEWRAIMLSNSSRNKHRLALLWRVYRDSKSSNEKYLRWYLRQIFPFPFQFTRGSRPQKHMPNTNALFLPTRSIFFFLLGPIFPIKITISKLNGYRHIWLNLLPLKSILRETLQLKYPMLEDSIENSKKSCQF